jgi:hypothetical protein
MQTVQDTADRENRITVVIIIEKCVPLCENLFTFVLHSCILVLYIPTMLFLQ